MKKTSMLLLVPILCSFSFANKNQINLEYVNNIIGMNVKDYFFVDSPVSIKSKKDVYFDTGKGFYLEFNNNENKQVGSMVFKPVNNTFKMVCSYEGDFKPFNDDNNYYVVADKYVTKNEFKLLNKYNNDFYSSRRMFKNTRIVSSSKYFNMKDQNGSLKKSLTIVGGSSGGLTKINNVPNYMNTQYNNNGCSPTTAAMYFSFLYRNFEYTKAKNITDNRNMPLNHTDNTSLVDSYIRYIGDNYFYTSNEGTNRNNIINGYNRYLSQRGYSNYKVHTTLNVEEFTNTIYNAANPVHISVDYSTGGAHSLLGIGYRSMYSAGMGAQTYIIANAVSNNQMTEVTFSIDDSFTKLANFYLIHK